MAEEQLHSSQVARLLVDLCDLCPPHGMRAAATDFQPYRIDPLAKPGVLARRHMRSIMKAAWPQILHARHLTNGDPLLESSAGRSGDIEFDRASCLLLDDRRAFPNLSGRENVPHL